MWKTNWRSQTVVTLWLLCWTLLFDTHVYFSKYFTGNGLCIMHQTQCSKNQHLPVMITWCFLLKPIEYTQALYGHQNWQWWGRVWTGAEGSVCLASAVLLRCWMMWSKTPYWIWVARYKLPPWVWFCIIVHRLWACNPEFYERLLQYAIV